MYKLSATLIAHQSDVKALSFLSNESLVSASRDATCRNWSRQPSGGWTSKVEYSGNGYLNSVAVDDQSNTYIGCLDGSIVVRELSDVSKWQGHEKNVCALDAKDGIVASGSWDCTARVWTKDGKAKHVLKGHEASVWGVAIIDSQTVITCSADKTIKIWKDGHMTSSVIGHTDVVRSVCDLGNGMFASCSNDGSVKVWTMAGECVQELLGHTSYVYMVKKLPSGELVSCGEDRSVRVWRDGECVQVITLPCTSVWSVSVAESNGDFAVGGSDYYIRIFSREESRWASKDEIDALNEAVASSGITKDQVGEVNKEELKGPETLQKPGQKEGQVVMIKTESGAVEAHQWTSDTWIKIGEVVGSAAGAGPQKQEFEGKMYDYVFKVNIEDGKPELSLPYNVTENPYTAATRFLERNELPLSYVDETARFIITNSESVNLGDAPAEDPYGSRYTASGGSSSAAPPPPKTKVVPLKTYLKLASFQADPIIKAVKQNNEKQSADKKLSNLELELIESGLKNLNADSAERIFKSAVSMCQSWSPEDMLPALDLLRISVALHPNPPTAVVIQMIFSTLDPDAPKHALLATRALVNLFSTPEGRKLVSNKQVGEQAISALRQLAEKEGLNAARGVACASLLLNYAILAGTSEPDVALALLESMTFFSGKLSDAESKYRLLLAVGTTLVNYHGVEEVKQAAKAFGLVDWAASLAGSESRVDEVLDDMNK